jgi:hypothetical protein
MVRVTTRFGSLFILFQGLGFRYKLVLQLTTRLSFIRLVVTLLATPIDNLAFQQQQGSVDNSVLLNPTVINGSIRNSTLVNPTIVTTPNSP